MIAHVRKEGEVYTVFTAESGHPLPLSGPTDEPPGGMIKTAIGLLELRQMFPGYEFQFHEIRKAPPKTLELSPAQEAAASTLYAQKAAEAAARVTAAPVRAQDQGGRKAPVVAPAGAEAKAEEFLKRLQVAQEYASAKNKRTLEIQITVVAALIAEVFPK